MQNTTAKVGIKSCRCARKRFVSACIWLWVITVANTGYISCEWFELVTCLLTFYCDPYFPFSYSTFYVYLIIIEFTHKTPLTFKTRAGPFTTNETRRNAPQKWTYFYFLYKILHLSFNFKGDNNTSRIESTDKWTHVICLQSWVLHAFYYLWLD